MVKEFSGALKSDQSIWDSARNIAIVVSRYNLEITDKLREGALRTLNAHRVPEKCISVVWVPGAWELVSATHHILRQHQVEGVVCLGCVIRGETTHDQHINHTVSQSLGRLSVDFSTPIAFGLLTCNTWDQAVERAGGRVGNKGVEATEALLEIFRLFDSLDTR